MTTRDSSGKYLTVQLGQEAFALPVHVVREIVRFSKITPIPQMPGYILGVLNLRGRIIPIVDLRIRFGMPAPVLERTCIVVVRVARPNGSRMHLGLVVDSVDDVSVIPESDVQPVPSWSGSVADQFLSGIARVEGEVKMLLDVDQVISVDVKEAVAHAA